LDSEKKISILPHGRTGGRRGYDSTSNGGGDKSKSKSKSNGDDKCRDTRNNMFESFRNLDDAIALANRNSVDDNDDGSGDGDRKSSLFEVSEAVCV
jgi:hypothetical protein